MSLKIILTGATGLVGEGVLLTCLQHPAVEKVLMVNRRQFNLNHPKLKELIVPDFFQLDQVSDALKGYNACFYCAGISSNGMTEKVYTYITYETTLAFAEKILELNPAAYFNFISGAHTDNSEKGRIMWARVKGKTENALSRLAFKQVHHFRPGYMKPSAGQQNIKGYYKIIAKLYPLLQVFFPNQGNTIEQLGLAMINSVQQATMKNILEVPDIKKLATLIQTS